MVEKPDDKTDQADESSESSDDSSESSDDAKTVDTSNITAPSIGPNTIIEKESPQERLARGEQTQTDAMGLDKHRQVVGGRYSASIPRQAALYGLAVAVVIGAFFGLKALVSELDQPPKAVANEAPWAGPDVKQRTPPPLQ